MKTKVIIEKEDNSKPVDLNYVLKNEGIYIAAGDYWDKSRIVTTAARPHCPAVTLFITDGRLEVLDKNYWSSKFFIKLNSEIEIRFK